MNDKKFQKVLQRFTERLIEKRDRKAKRADLKVVPKAPRPKDE